MRKETVSSAMILLLISMLTSSLTSVRAAPETTVAVASMTVANPGEHVSVNVTIADVTDLFSYQTLLAFDGAILDAIGATEGPFLEEGTSSPSGTYFTYQIRDEVQGTYVVVVCVTLGHYPGVTGSGTLFSVDFVVRDGGTSELHLYDTILVDSSGTEISHATSDGIFHTTVPRAAFSFTTEYPTTGEDVTFDASNSYDPDGTIVSYTWDFGDGTTGTGMVATHSYAEEDDYTVTLEVMDNDGLSDDTSASIHPRAPLLAYIAVPYHRQITGYHCGPAALEMVCDFYGPDISQREIADAARTAPDGTYTCEMVRAAHFSDLSTFPIGGHPEDERGYTARQLGYAALECWDMTIEQLTSLIAAGYPIIVLTTWHYRVAVGYSSTRITFQDSYYGENLTLTYDAFDVNWDYSSHWALFVSPWEVTVHTPSDVSLGDVFTVIATITYPSPPPFPSNQYPASLPNATVTLPDGLSLGPGETAKKTIGSGELAAGESINVTWAVRAESLGSHTILIEAEGKVAGFVPPLPSYPESYAYEDRIGGVSEAVVEIASPAGPVEDIRELIETIIDWSLPRGTTNCLITRLERAVWLLEMDNKDGAIRLLLVFVRTVEALRGRRLTEEQADYLTPEAQRIAHHIEG
jgi:hypothetical protein